MYFPHVRTTVRENTFVGYESAYRLYIRPMFGNTDLETITVRDVQTWITQFDKPGCAKRSYATLRQIIRYATDVGVYNADDPTKHNIQLPDTLGNQNKVLTSQEVVELVNGFRGHELEACVLCSVTMGLRRCECFGLKWKDIDLTTGAVRVHRSRQYVNGTEVVYPTKTKKSTRTCYLPKFALVRMRRIRRRPDEWLLPVPVSHAAYIYRRHVQDNGLPYTPFMNLRHTWATLAVESGTDVLVVAQMLGHTDASMAYSRYVRPSNAVHKQAQQRFDNLVTRNRSTCVVSLVRHIVSLVRNLLMNAVFGATGVLQLSS